MSEHRTKEWVVAAQDEFEAQVWAENWGKAQKAAKEVRVRLVLTNAPSDLIRDIDGFIKAVDSLDLGEALELAKGLRQKTINWPGPSRAARAATSS